MTDMPTTTVTCVTRDAWIARAQEQADFCDLTHAEQDQLATAFNQTIDSNLDSTGRILWATNFERRLREGWAIPCPQTREVTLGTLGM